MTPAKARVGPGSPPHVVLTTMGSLGDLYPYVAIARGLQRREYRTTVATGEGHRRRVEAEGIAFRAVRPDLTDLARDRKTLALALDRRKGSGYVIRRILMPHLAASYDDLATAVRDADLLITHSITFAGPLVAQRAGLRWISSVLMPLKFYSAYDPCVPGSAPDLTRLRMFGPRLYRWLLHLGKLGIRPWTGSERRLRQRLGLPPGKDPIIEGQHSPELVLALFSKVLAQPQPDWPANTLVTGFPFYDTPWLRGGLPPALRRFLEAGPRPVVFTLGSAVGLVHRSFYLESLRAAQDLGCRAVMVVPKQLAASLPDPLPRGIMVFDSVAYAPLLSRAAALISHGGVGTIAAALRAGCPMLVVPYGYL